MASRLTKIKKLGTPKFIDKYQFQAVIGSGIY